MEQIKNSNYYALNKASQLTDIHSSTLRRWCKAGSIKYVCPGKRKLYVLVDGNKVVFNEKEK